MGKAIFAKLSTFARSGGFGFFTISLFIIFLAIFKIFTAGLFPAKIQASDLTIQNIQDGVNRERSLRNLVVLNQNSKLANAAQSKADDMMQRKYFSHIDPEGHYIWDKIIAEGYAPYLQLGENLAIEFYDTNSLISAWMNSPTHRANLLNDGFKDQGMGLSFGAQDKDQYHSAIANTFGALLIKKASAQTPQTPTKTELLKIPAQTSPVIKKPLAAPLAQKPADLAPGPEPTPEPKKLINVRGEETLIAQKEFLLPNKNAATQTAASTKQTSAKAEPIDAPVFGQEEKNGYKKYRLYILVLGGILALMLVSDIKFRLEEQTGHADKKINNLLILILSLIVVGFMYWM